MNDLTVALFLICFVGIAGATFAFMWKMTAASLEAMNRPPIKREVNIHPEMQDVRSGTSLLVFNANQEDDDDDDGDIIVVRP